ncbi:MAG: sodium:proton antiporter [Candidatus Latescibacteria bacterium]|jgi:monovalent cation:H+ antiporter, CPA1 family|nr:sodium:proton antiporter [Candidatus Latescibacterota bacterium]
MNIFDIAAILIGLSALFGFVNHRVLHLPHTIGLVVIALVSSLTLVGLDLVLPDVHIGADVSRVLQEIDFNEALMKGMLSFLLFAGALHVDISELASGKWPIILMATLGVLVSTFVIGGVMWAGLQLFGIPLPLIWALVFGALISPTDPVAVLGLLKTIQVPPSLEAKIAGESLFNDGVGVVLFSIILAVAVGSQQGVVGPLEILELFVVETGGGAVLGLLAGYLAFRAMRGIDEYALEVLISLALVMVTYAVANAAHLSGPIAVVIAGLFIGNHGVRFAMSETTSDHLLKFWTLSDEILNSVLFLLIGLEVLVMRFDLAYLEAALLAIPVVVVARLVSVVLPALLPAIRRTYTPGTIPLLVWGGLRGGISVALAFSLPDNEYKSLILTVTYSVVVFSIIVQGMTVKPLATKLMPQQ